MDILFLGDSITDCDHCFSSDNLGYGYVKLVSARLLQAGIRANCINAGTDGFTLQRMRDRYIREFQHRQFDVTVVLGGINDLFTAVDTGRSAAMADAFLQDSLNAFRELLCTMSDTCAYILYLEPFLFSYPASGALFMPALDSFREKLRRVCEAVSQRRLRTIRTQEFFDQICQTTAPEQLTTDGVHLTGIGHKLLAERIIQEFAVLSKYC